MSMFLEIVVSLAKRYVWILNVVLIILISYELAYILTGRIKDKIEVNEVDSYEIVSNTTSDRNKRNVSSRYKNLSIKTPPRDYYDVILTRNIFGVDTTVVASNVHSEQAGEVLETDLNVELLGTFLSSRGDSIAVIKNLDSGKSRGYKEGDAIDILDGHVELVSIDNCSVLIKRKRGRTETIRCKKEIGVTSESSKKAEKKHNKTAVSRRKNNDVFDKGVKLIGNNRWQIDKKMLDELLEDPTSLITQARVVPQKDGLRFFGIRPNSIFYKIGLRNGDILHRINDVELNNVENALGLFGELRNQTEFFINFTRRGKKYTYEYVVN